MHVFLFDLVLTVFYFFIYIQYLTIYIINGPGSDSKLKAYMSHFLTFLISLFDLILYVPSTIFQLNRDVSSWVEPVLSKDKFVLLKDHNAVTLVRLEFSVSSQALYH